MATMTTWLESLLGISGVTDNIFLFLANVFPFFLLFFLVAFLFNLHITNYRFSTGKNRMEQFRLWMLDNILIIFSALSGWLIAEILKQVSMIPRPYIADPTLHHILAFGNYTAFPSMHTAIMSAVSFIVLFSHRTVGIFLLASSIVIGLSRVVVGVHYVSDIVGGVLVGLLVAFVLATIDRHIENARKS